MSVLFLGIAGLSAIVAAVMALAVVTLRSQGKDVEALKRRGIKLAIFTLICFFLSVAFEPSKTEQTAETAPASSEVVQTASSESEVKEEEPVSVASSSESEAASVSVASEPEQGVTVLSPKDLWENGEAYLNQQVEVTGEIIRISDYSDMKGYYLYGTTGEGLVFWIYEKDRSADIGDTVTFRGTVQNLGEKQVEVTDCEIVK